MALLNDAELAKAIRGGEIKTVYYFYGKDVAVLSSYTERLVTKLAGKDENALELHRLDGRKLSMSELWDCCNMLPCFSERVVVTVNDLNCDGIGKEDFDYIQSIVSELPDTTTLIFYATGVDLYKNRRSLTDRNDKLCRLCAKIGDACEFSYKTPAELSKTIVGKVRKLGCEMSAQNASYLAQKCLCEQEAVNAEISKLTAYAQGREITQEDIDALCAHRPDADAFRLAGAILKGSADAAFVMINELYDMQTPTQMIIAAMANSFCDIYKAKTAMMNKKSIADVIKDMNFPKNREFALKYAFNDCRSVSEKKLRRCINALSEADTMSKQSRADSRMILERCVTVMLGK